MLDTGHFEDVAEFLHSCVDSIKKNYPRFSNLQLAKRLGIPSSTFDRICKKEVQRPTFNHALKIAKEVCGPDRVQEFIKKYYPRMYMDFESVYPGNSEVPFVAPPAESHFQDAATYEILIMATTDVGLSRQKVADELGKRGLSTLERLLQNGILKEEGGTISLHGKINATQETVHKLLQNLLRNNYDLEAFGDHRNWLSLQYESVKSDVVVPQIRDILIEANQKIRKVMNAEESKGSDVIWTGLVFDSLAKHESDGTTKVNGQSNSQVNAKVIQ